MSVENQAIGYAERRLHYCGLKMASPSSSSSSPEGERSAVDCSDWLSIESACVMDVGGVCSSSSA